MFNKDIEYPVTSKDLESVINKSKDLLLLEENWDDDGALPVKRKLMN